MTLPAPYPADTRAKGWRFEIDYEKVEQSSTWALAPADMRPWLLMLWVTAWKQVPCGSLDNDDALIAARIGMSAKTFTKHREVLRRGWWLAEDGRLYHDTIALRVSEMLEYRRKNALRQANHKGKKSDSRTGNALPAGEQPISNDTGTGTGTGTIPSLRSGSAPANPGEACKAMKAVGMQSVSPSHPKLISLLEAGITIPELVDAATHAVQNSKPFAYALATAEGRRRDSATAALPVAGNKQEALEASNAAVAARFLEGQTHAAH